jgi:hypothetical protein
VDPTSGVRGDHAFEVRSLAKVLDVTQRHSSLIYSALVYERALDQEILHSSSWKPEYLVPRFVADVARAKGFSAMLYRTSKVYWAQGLSLVGFDPKAESMVQTGPPSMWERAQRGSGDWLEPVWYETRPLPPPEA